MWIYLQLRKVTHIFAFLTIFLSAHNKEILIQNYVFSAVVFYSKSNQKSKEGVIQTKEESRKAYLVLAQHVISSLPLATSSGRYVFLKIVPYGSGLQISGYIFYTAGYWA